MINLGKLVKSGTIKPIETIKVGLHILHRNSKKIFKESRSRFDKR